MFDKISSGLTEQNILEHMFAINFIYNNIVILIFVIHQFNNPKKDYNEFVIEKLRGQKSPLFV